LARKIRINFEEHCDIKLKEACISRPCDITLERNATPTDDFKGINFLGVQYGIVYAANQKPEVFWRHDPLRVMDWKERLLEAGTNVTHRQISKILGTILWHYTVAGIPLCQHDDVMTLLRRVAKSVNGVRKRWDEPYDAFTEKDLILVNTELQAACANPIWHEKAHATLGDVYMFTDAAGSHQMGCVVLRANGTAKEIRGNPFDAGVAASHIFLKEMAAACWYVESCILRNVWRSRCIYLGVDNSAVAFALRHFYSSNTIANRWLKRLWDVLEQHQCRLEIVQVTSEDNPADEPSRGSTTVDQNRLQRGWKTMQDYIAGKTSGRPSEEHHGEDPSELRHPLDGMSILDDCDCNVKMLENSNALLEQT
jgi:hypothetical protein